eukprot:UN01966
MGQLCSCARAPRDGDTECSSWDDHFPSMTRTELRNKREMFWETRSSGIREIWYGLRSAAQLIRDGDDDSAQAVICAIGCTPLKLGRSKKSFFSYDERGAKYVMPLYLFEEPKTLIENMGLLNNANINCGVDQKEDLNMTSNEEISFRVRLNIGKDICVKMKEEDSIQELKEYISVKLNNFDPTKIRIIKRGKMYKNNYKIGTPFPITNGDIIHASLPSAAYKQSMQSVQSNE